MDGRDRSIKDRRKEGLWNGWKGWIHEGIEGSKVYGMDGRDPSMKDRRNEGLLNGWKGWIDEGQKEGRFMEWMEGIDP